MKIRARVIRSSMREFLCKIIGDGSVVTAKAFGAIMKGDGLVVGDYVKLSFDKMNSEYSIVEVEERKNTIFRTIVREGKKKVTAANCDLLVIVVSIKNPTFKRGIIDRFLVRAFEWSIPAIVVFNKMDQYNSSDNLDLLFERDRIEQIEADCFEISALDEHYRNKILDYGINDLKSVLKGKTSIFVGQSGVGKSKVISMLSGGTINLKSMEIGKKSGKGTHTTTWSEIIEGDDFTVIDSPGIRSFSLNDITRDDLISYFPDLEEIAVRCKFNSCKHDEKALGCAFFKLDKNTYSSQLIFSRLESYLHILHEGDVGG